MEPVSVQISERYDRNDAAVRIVGDHGSTVSPDVQERITFFQKKRA
jgi:hypothetical protein